LELSELGVVMSFGFKRGREAATAASNRPRAAARTSYRRLQLESLEARIVLDAAPTLIMPTVETVQNADIEGGFSGPISLSVPDADAFDQEALVAQVTSGTLSLGNEPQVTLGSYPFGSLGLTSVTYPDGSYYLCNSFGEVVYQGTGTATGYIAMTGTAISINEALEYLVYQPPPLLSSGTAVLSVLAEDASGNNVQSQSSTIDITSPTLPPSIDGPASQTMTPGTLIFSQANHNAITVSDPGAGAQVESVQVQANGTLSPGSDTSGVTVMSGPNYPGGLGLEGTVAALNSALDGLQYTPNPGVTSDLLNVTINDDNEYIGGRPQTAFLSTQITVSSVPTPVLDFGVANASITEHSAATGSAGLTFSTANGNAITVDGANNTTQSFTAVLEALTGTLNMPNTSSAATIVGNGTSLISLTGTPVAIDEALEGLNYQPASNVTSDILEGYVVTPGSNGPATLSTWIPIAVDPGSDDLPIVNGIPGPQAVLAGSVLEFSQAGGNAVRVADGDANGSTETIFLQVLYGTLAVGNTAALSSASGNGTSLLILSGTVPNLNAALDGLRYLYAPPADSPSGDGNINSDYLSILISDNAPVTDNSASAGVQISIT
jgi:large repetitive protein